MSSNSDHMIGTKKRANFKLLLRGLTGKLLLWFLLIALVPVTTVSLISYLNSRNSLIRAANDLLVSTARFKAEKVLSLGERWLIDVSMQARNKENIRLLRDLRKAYEASGQSLAKFVESFSWLEIEDEHGGDLRNFQTSHGYSDIFLIDSDGNILFSSFGNNDLGTNLLSGKYSDTLFARTAGKVFKTGISGFSDFEVYGPLNNQVTGFVVHDMLDDEGNKIGLVAIGIHARQIDFVMNELSDSGKKSAEVYLVGTDLNMRTNSILSKKETILKKRIDTEQTRAWHEHKADKVEIDHMKKALVYTGPHGKKVLGVHCPIRIGDVPFGVIAEIEEQEAFAPAIELRAIVIVLLIATGVVVLFFAVFLARRIARPILDLSKSADRVAAGRFDQEIQIKSRDEIGRLEKSFSNMVNNLRHMTEEDQRQNWLRSGAAQLNDVMSGEKRPAALSRGVISFLAGYLGAQVGAIYLMDNHNRLRIEGSYAFKKNKKSAPVFEVGEGLIGQAAVDKKPLLVTDVPKDYLTVNSGLGDAPPRNILLVPFLHEGEVKGVIELGAIDAFTERKIGFLEETGRNIAVAFSMVQSANDLRSLLEESRERAEELQASEEELRDLNEELVERTTELELKTLSLERQRELVGKKNIDLEAAGKALEERAMELEKSTKVKSEFLANMSHEIRTPMNGVIGMIDMLLDTELTPEQLDFAQSVQTSADALLMLINDILDFSKIEAGKLDMESIDFDLRPTLETLSDVMAMKSNEKGVEFACLIHDRVPCLLRGDPGRLRQILTNLTGNAIKFVEKGEVSIHVDLKAETDTDVTLLFEVKDTGIGIPPSKVDRLFDSFTQVDASTTRKYGGTGLGLTISKQLSELMGGEIGVRSQEGKGTTFWFTVVLEKQSDAEEKTIVGIEDLKGKNILVVDDHSINRQVFRVYLESWGCRFDEAENGNQALSKLRDAANRGDPFHIGILDMQMPEMTGEALCRTIKDDPAIKDTALVMATSVAQRGDAERLKKSGFAAFLTKPVKKSILFDCLRIVLGLKDDRSKDASRQIVTRFTVEESRVGEEEAGRNLRILLAEDNLVNQKVAMIMLKKMGHSIVVAGNGQEAVAKFEEDEFDLILMDGQMPIMDGLEAAGRIRELELKGESLKLKGGSSKLKGGEASDVGFQGSTRLEHVPIIAVTANAMKGDRERFLAAGMDDYITKPLKRKVLEDAIGRVIGVS